MLVTDSARAHLEACTVSACQGPALDASLHGRLSAADCSLTGCVGVPACPPLFTAVPPSMRGRLTKRSIPAACKPGVPRLGHSREVTGASAAFTLVVPEACT